MLGMVGSLQKFWANHDIPPLTSTSSSNGVCMLFPPPHSRQPPAPAGVTLACPNTEHWPSYDEQKRKETSFGGKCVASTALLVGLKSQAADPGKVPDIKWKLGAHQARDLAQQRAAEKALVRRLLPLGPGHYRYSPPGSRSLPPRSILPL